MVDRRLAACGGRRNLLAWLRHAPPMRETSIGAIPLHICQDAVDSSYQFGIAFVKADSQGLRIVGDLPHNSQTGGLACEPSSDRVYFHDRGDAPGGEISHGVVDAVEWVNLYSLDLSSLLHSDRDVIVGRRSLHSDNGFIQVCEALDLWRSFTVDHQAERGGHVRRGPGQHLLPRRRDGDPADNAVVET